MFFIVLRFFSKFVFHVLIYHGSDLGLSAFCASLTLIVNNFLYDHNLTKTF